MSLSFLAIGTLRLLVHITKQNLSIISEFFQKVFFPGHWIFKLTECFQPHFGSGVNSVSAQRSTKNLPGRKGWLAPNTDNFTAICEPMSRNVELFMFHSPMGF
jgi:hypothetical protein